MSAVKVFFLFERRRSNKHKWVPAVGCDGSIASTLDNASNVFFVPKKWYKYGHDKQGAQFLATILHTDANASKKLPSTLRTSIDSYCAAHANTVYKLIDTERLNRNLRHQSTYVQRLSNDDSVVYHAALTLRQMVLFFDDLQSAELHSSIGNVKHNPTPQHTILRLLYEHMRLKLCTLHYPQVRVHFLVTTMSDSVVDSDVSDSSGITDSDKVDDTLSATKTGSDSGSSTSNAEVGRPHLTETATSAPVRSADDGTLSADYDDQSSQIDCCAASLQVDGTKNGCVHTLLLDDACEADGSADSGWDLSDIDFEARPPTPPAAPKQLSEPRTGHNDETEDSFTDSSRDEDAHCASNSQPTVPVVADDADRVCVSTYPAQLSILPDATVLAISQNKREARAVTLWLQKYFFQCTNRRSNVCFIGNNLSADQCERFEQYVESKKSVSHKVVIGVECEFRTSLSHESRVCKTLLNEFDGRTSNLIMKLQSLSHTVVVFETTKSFNHVWCWKYNILNTAASGWFDRANRNATTPDHNSEACLPQFAVNEMATQRACQAAAIVQLIKQRSEPTLSCAEDNLIPLGKECFFDTVVLGYSADLNEKQVLFNFIGDQMRYGKLENARWQSRVCRLQRGDAFLVPVSRRQNNFARKQIDNCNRAADIAKSLSATQLKPRGTFNLYGTVPLSIPTPSSYLFTNLTDYKYGDPFVLKNTM